MIRNQLNIILEPPNSAPVLYPLGTSATRVLPAIVLGWEQSKGISSVQKIILEPPSSAPALYKTSLVTTSSLPTIQLFKGIFTPAGSVGSVSAVNNPTAAGQNNAIGIVTGVTVVSAENNPLGYSNSLPSGVISASAENSPSGIGNGIGTATGVTSVSAVNNPTAAGQNNAIGIVTGVTVATAVNNPTAAGQNSATGVVTGVTVVSAINNPTASGAGSGIAAPMGVTVTSAENNPVGNSNIPVSGVTVVSVENNPTVIGQNSSIGIAVGVIAVLAENNPTASSQRSATAVATGVAAILEENNPIAVGVNNATAVITGVLAISAINNPTIALSEIGLATGMNGVIIENSPKGLAFAAAAGVGSSSSFTNPTVPPILVATIPTLINPVFSGAMVPISVVPSSALAPWTIESSAPWLTAQQIDSTHALIGSVSENDLPHTGFSGRVNMGTYTGYIKITSGENVSIIPVVHNVGYGDFLDTEYIKQDYPFS